MARPEPTPKNTFRIAPWFFRAVKAGKNDSAGIKKIAKSKTQKK